MAFDADDTLWVNETFFREAEAVFANMLTEYASEQETLRILYEVEMSNMELYGYGIKAFMLSLIEAANIISGFRITARQTDEIIQIGKDMLNKPVDLLDGVEPTLQLLHKRVKLIVATKGDLLDQERKLRKSGLLDYFHHIEVMSDKNTASYAALIKHLDIEASELVMVGNSVKSDILPVVELGGWGVHIPFHTTWHHEEVRDPVQSKHIFKIERIDQLIPLLNI